MKQKLKNNGDFLSSNHYKEEMLLADVYLHGFSTGVV
jgi:hypothetical protein